MKKLYSKIAFALLISIFPYSVIGQDDLPPEQLAMLEQLPPDQRESIKELSLIHISEPTRLR